ncbi:MAG: cell cycle transcriptional regulator TrcR [Pseudomonadota bacterium]
MTQLLMPKATAVWLVDNTALTFDQIAKFCGLHALEVKAIADGESAQGIKGLDPINTGQLTREEIAKAEADPAFQLTMLEPKVRVPQLKKKGPRYTPVSKRQDRPNAILWLVRSHPELKDAQISRLVGTTKNTITQIRDRTHWNSANLQPIDPVALGLCTQIDLDFEVQKAAKSMPRPVEGEVGDQLLPASQTEDLPVENEVSDATLEQEAEAAFANFDNTPSEPAADAEPEIDPDSVFAKLKSLKSDGES